MTARAALAAAVVIASAAAVSGAVSATAVAPRLTLATHGKLVSRGSGVEVSGTILCGAKRYFSLSFIAVEPARSAAAVGWGTYPAPGAAAASHTCSSGSRTWRVVLGQGTKRVAGTFARGSVRVCVIFRTFGKRARSTLNATCRAVGAR